MDNDYDDGICRVCKRKFKNARGVKIHQGKSVCGRNLTEPHRRVSKSEDVSTRESPHRRADIREERKGRRHVPSRQPAMIFTRRSQKVVTQTESREETKEHPKDDILKIKPEEVEEILEEIEDRSGYREEEEDPRSRKMIQPAEGKEAKEHPKEENIKVHTEVEDMLEKRADRPDVTEDEEDMVQEPVEKSKEAKFLKSWLTTSDRKKPSKGDAWKVLDEVRPVKKRKSLNSKESKFLKSWLNLNAREKTIREEVAQESQSVRQQESEEPTSHPQQSEKVQKEPGILMLSSDDQAQMRKRIAQGNKEDIMVEHNLCMRKRDMRSLQGVNWLGDKIIDEYLWLIKRRSEANNDYPTMIAMTVFFYKKLDRLGLTEGYEQTSNWITEDLREKEVILVPIHKGDHWSLVHVDIDLRVINYLDSLVGSRYSSAAPGMMKRYMEEYHRQRGEVVKYKIRIRNDVPRQLNSVDCGVFVCQYSDRIGRRGRFDFQQSDMPAIRWKMTWEILNGELRETMKQTTREEPATARKSTPEKKESSSTNRKGKVKPGRKKKEHHPEETEDMKKKRINWPKMNSAEWQKLDTDLMNILSNIGGTAEKKAEAHPNLIYSFCLERFGPVEKEGKKVKPEKGLSRRQKKLKELREEISKLKEAYNSAPEGEKDAIDQLQEEKLKKARLMKRAETLKSKRRQFKQNSEEFTSQPFAFARKVLTAEVKGKLESTKEEVEKHLKDTHSDVRREEEMPLPDDLYEYPEPVKEFEMSPPTWREFSRLLRRTRNKSAPGPNGIPYKLYKKCPGVAKLLWLYLKGLWRKEVMSSSWRRAEGVFIPKEDGASVVGKFRTISLLNVEGKLSFGLLAFKLTNFTMANNYIDASIQKGGIPGVSGCLEHTAVLSQLIREAKQQKKNLVVSWLDIANAYGSMPHTLIQIALRQSHVPEKIRDLIRSYYSDVKIRFTTEEFTTEWQRVEKGIITGCTLSVVLFALTMTMLVLSVRRETKGPQSSTGQEQENTRLFMDDVTTTAGTIVQTNHLLGKLGKKFEWARLKVKPEKCRSLVIIKGEISRRTVVINQEPITSIMDKSIKYLGKEYNLTLEDRKQTEDTEEKVKAGLKRINKCRLLGRYKSWILQHMLIPKMMWPLTLYNIPASKVERMEGLLTASLKKWLGLPRSMSTDIMYSTSVKLQLPYTALSEEVKVAKARSVVTFQTSKDPCIRNAAISVEAGRKWNIAGEVEEAKSRLRLQEIAGIANIGREGLGMNHRQYYSSSSEREKRALIVKTVREKEEETRRFKIAGLRKQGACNKWEVPGRKISHKDIITSSETSLKFLIKSVYDLLPTPANKNVWFNTEENRCALCDQAGTLNHILSGCKVALQQGRYKWRHDKVLRELAYWVEEKKRTNNAKPAEKRQKINFVKAGEKKKSVKNSTEATYLSSSRDWRLEVDLDKQLKVPGEIAVTNLRPDMLLISKSTKQLGIIELTVPSEQRVEISSELKKNKYAVIEEEGRLKGWKTRVWAVEVGCRGFPASSLSSMLREMGCTGRERKTALKKIGWEAETASHSVWRWSHSKQWGAEKK